MPIRKAEKALLVSKRSVDTKSNRWPASCVTMTCLQPWACVSTNGLHAFMLDSAGGQLSPGDGLVLGADSFTSGGQISRLMTYSKSLTLESKEHWRRTV
jgi:hypothetical protein